MKPTEEKEPRLGGNPSEADSEATVEAAPKTEDTQPAPAVQRLRPGLENCTLEANGIRHIEASEAERLIGCRQPGILLPYHTALGSPLKVDGKPFARLRLDSPYMNGAKYLSPSGSGSQLFIPLNLPARETLFVCEGEFKAMALAECGYMAVGLGGINGAMPGGQLLPALKSLIAQPGVKRVYFLGDADSAFIAGFAREAEKFARVIKPTPLFLPRIPVCLGANGIDDLKEAIGPDFIPLFERICGDALEVGKMDANRVAVQLVLPEIETLAQHSRRPEYESRIIELATELDDAAVMQIAAEMKTQLSMRESVFVSSVKAARKKKSAKLAKDGDRHSANQARQAPPAEIPEGTLVLPSDGKFSISESAHLLFGTIAEKQNLFIRGNVVHSISREAASKWLTLEEVLPDRFRSLAEKYGTLAAFRTGPHGEVLLKTGVNMSHDIAKALLASEERKLLPEIACIHHCPVLVETAEGGVEILEKGYHEQAGGRLILSGTDLPQLELAEATRLLRELFDEFEFVSDADRSRAVALLLGPAMGFGRFLNAHAPIGLFEANDSQAGKGYLAELIQSVYNDIPAMAYDRQRGVGGFDESLSAALMKGRPFVQIDNIRGEIDSLFFESLLTVPLDGTVPARVPHKNAVEVSVRDVVFHLTSNGVKLTNDLANRCVIVRIRKREQTEFRDWPEGKLLDHVKANQPLYLSAVFRVIGQWVVEGKPGTNDLSGQGKFRRWNQAMDWIVQNLFGLTPLLDGHRDVQLRTSTRELNFLRVVCEAAKDQSRLGHDLKAADVVGICDNAGIDIAGSKSHDDAPIALGRVLGRAFAKVQDVVVLDSITRDEIKTRHLTIDRFTVSREERREYIPHRMEHSLVKNYVIAETENGQ